MTELIREALEKMGFIKDAIQHNQPDDETMTTILEALAGIEAELDI